jgi:aconitate hydratase
MLKVGDNITTDHISPAGTRALPFRSNIPAISQFVFESIDPDFAKNASNQESIAIMGGENYGQGSSREHAALAPRYLGVQVKLAKSFARIHHANLVNYGILPLTFANPDDYDLVKQGERMIIEDVRKQVLEGANRLSVRIGDRTVEADLTVSDRQRQILTAGGLLNLIREQG